ncbi:penicillin-binding protein [Nibribacter ruber]|uniref:Penicillin-binding protein n=1 Tax=Nibribacter ruber TaxID=2698458 RepID=A0A6P1P357_9BACT|nr:transglycosylase domain-containing protein [Nibribacter ruber]QHL88820.1 penicillin-binding protein [Nibribacter ruber]
MSEKKKKKIQPQNKYNKWVRNLWKVFGAGLVLVILYFVAVDVNFLYLFGESPGLDELENPRSNVPSEIYTADGVMVGRYFRENRDPVPFDSIAPIMAKALIATEDERFYKHQGIDPVGLLAAIKDNLSGDTRGASTITQQLAKNLYKTRTKNTKGVLGYIPGVSTLIAKTKEWNTAIKLEQRYTKDEILGMYLNTVDYGSNAFGIKVAANTFFSTTPDSLKPEEAAMLVGVLKAPTTYNPRFNPKNALARRNVVLEQMAKNKVLTKAQADSLSQLPIDLKYHVEEHLDGVPAYYRQAVNEFVRNWSEEKGLDFYSEGLKIYLTIDSRMQRLAEEALREKMKSLQRRFESHWRGRNPWVDEKDQEIPNFIETSIKRTAVYQSLKNKHGKDTAAINRALNTPHKMEVFTWKGMKDTTLSSMDSLRYYKRFLHAGLMTMDPYTGHIKAWVGGIDYENFKYDHVKQARRQPGSTFKPFVYAAAIDQGYSPCDKIQDQRVTIKYVEDGKNMEWTPHNADYSISGRQMTLRHAMGRSVNTVTAQLTEAIGWDTVRKFARKLGITSPLEAVPSIGLGSSDVSVFEMVNAYSTFINNGFLNKPILVLKIEDRNGNLIEQFNPQQKRVISEETAFLMVHMLKGTMEEPGGTSQALWEYELWKKGNQVAGKTGTTSNHSDGWYMGVTKDLVTGVWVGGEDRSIHFRTSAMGEGSKTALPIFGRFMEKVYQDPTLGIKLGPFPKPTVKIKKPYNCVTVMPRKPKVVDSLAVDSLLQQLNDSISSQF